MFNVLEYLRNSAREEEDKQWVCNKANTKISDCQALKQQFCRWLDRRHFAKSDQDQTIAKTCGDQKENVQSGEKVNYARQ